MATCGNFPSLNRGSLARLTTPFLFAVTTVGVTVPVTDGDITVLGPDELWRKVLADPGQRAGVLRLNLRLGGCFKDWTSAGCTGADGA